MDTRKQTLREHASGIAMDRAFLEMNVQQELKITNYGSGQRAETKGLMVPVFAMQLLRLNPLIEIPTLIS